DGGDEIDDDRRRGIGDRIRAVDVDGAAFEVDVEAVEVVVVEDRRHRAHEGVAIAGCGQLDVAVLAADGEADFLAAAVQNGDVAPPVQVPLFVHQLSLDGLYGEFGGQSRLFGIAAIEVYLDPP